MTPLRRHARYPWQLSICLMQFVQQNRGTSVNPAEWPWVSVPVSLWPRAQAESHNNWCTLPLRHERINTCLSLTVGLMRNGLKPPSKPFTTNLLTSSAETIIPVIFSAWTNVIAYVCIQYVPTWVCVCLHVCDSVCHNNVSKALIWKSTQGLLVGIHSKD